MTDSTIPNLTQRQIMLSFAFLAYSGEQITTPNPESTICDLINTAMPKVPPIAAPAATWEIVWGPATYTPPGGLYQDHMMYVVQNQSDLTQLAVAIRGTNGVSQADWLADDLDIRQMMPWPPGAIGSDVVGQISESTSIDLQTLLSMPDPLGNEGKTLVQYLGGAVSGATSVCVTGHSKGGVMSSTLALYLKESQPSWDPGGQAVVSNISFAGPTAGNAGFASHSDSQFASPASYPPGWDSSLKTTCDRVHNSLDVATLAWDYDNYDAVIALYEPEIRFHGIEWDLASSSVKSAFQNLLQPMGYTQIEAGQAAVTGTLSGQHKPASDSILNTVKAYAGEAGYQHHNYPVLLGVPQLMDPTIVVENQEDPS